MAAPPAKAPARLPGAAPAAPTGSRSTASSPRRSGQGSEGTHSVIARPRPGSARATVYGREPLPGAKPVETDLGGLASLAQVVFPSGREECIDVRLRRKVAVAQEREHLYSALDAAAGLERVGLAEAEELHAVVRRVPMPLLLAHLDPLVEGSRPPQGDALFERLALPP